MRRDQIRGLERDLEAYLSSMIDGMGRPERRRAMNWYVTGLLLDGERKSLAPMAARLVDHESEAEAMRQRLQECVGISAWSEAEVFGRLARKFEAELPAVEAFVIDDTGHPKKGRHSVGVARQYSGTLGRTDNCQVAVSLHLAGEAGSGCVGYRLYLNNEWAEDAKRRKKAGVPAGIGFLPKWKIALEQLDAALEAGVRKHVVLADAGYGEITDFRDWLLERGLSYVVGVNGLPLIWPPESRPRVAVRTAKTGPIPTRHVDDKHPPEPIGKVALRMQYRSVTWREGARGRQRGRFAATRVRTAHKHYKGRAPGEEQWLLVEWPAGRDAPTKYWLAALPPNTPLRRLVQLAKLRWRVERDYQEMKQELGLDHFEGRSWRGFHHHAALCALAHGFLALQRALSPPEPATLDSSAGAPPSPTRLAAADRLLPAL
jgi:SRSO17 transposase